MASISSLSMIFGPLTQSTLSGLEAMTIGGVTTIVNVTTFLVCIYTCCYGLMHLILSIHHTELWTVLVLAAMVYVAAMAWRARSQIGEAALWEATFRPSVACKGYRLAVSLLSNLGVYSHIGWLLWTIGFNIAFQAVYSFFVLKDLFHLLFPALSSVPHLYLKSSHRQHRHSKREALGSCEMRAFRVILKLGHIVQYCELTHFRQPFMGIVCSVPSEDYYTERVALSHASIIDYRRKDWKEVLHDVKSSGHVSKRHRVLFYVHGGGFISGDFGGFKTLVDKLSRLLGARAVFPHYRLTPECSFDDGISDVMEAYRYMIVEARREHEEVEIIIAADSAGCTLMLLALQRMVADCNHAVKYEKPLAAILLSGITDISMSGASLKENATSDVMLKPESLEWGVNSALNSLPEDRRCHRCFSPLYGSMEGLPSLFLSASRTEMLLDDTLRLAEVAREAGVHVVVDLTPVSFHAYACYWKYVPESLHLLQRACAHVDYLSRLQRRERRETH